MVAIVSGNSLGLTSSSLDRLGQQGSLGQSVHGRAGEGVYVNSTTGNLVVQRTDEVLMGVGPDVNVLRTYNSLGQFDGDNNDNWRIGFYRQIKTLTGTINTAGSSIVRVEADGAERLYTYDTASARYLNQDGTGATDALAYSTATSQWTWTDGDSRVTETYDWLAGNGKLLSTQDIDGNKVTYDYTAGLLTKVTTANSISANLNITELVYDTTTGKTSNLLQIKTTAWNGTAPQVLTRVRYTYDASNRLSTVTVDLSPEDNNLLATGSGNANDGKTYVTTYTYVDSTSKRIASITESNGTSVTFLYDSNGRVRQFTEGGDRTTTLTYLVSSPVVATSLGAAPGPANPVYTVTAADLAAADPWATITNKVYGVQLTDAAAVAALQAVLGNPTLSAGQLLSPPASLAYDKSQVVPANLITGNVVTPTSAWTAQQSLESSSTAANEPQVAFGPNGDGLSVWTQGSDLMASVFTKSTGQWSAPTAIDGNLAGDPYRPHLSVSANGSMLVTWGQYVPSPPYAFTIHARRYVNGAWDASATTIPTLSTGFGSSVYYPTGAISDSGRAVVMFATSDGRWNISANYFNGSTWQSTASNVDDVGAVNNNGANSSLLPRVSMDSAGNATVVWAQPAVGETNTSLFVSRYTVSNGQWGAPSSTALENSTVAVDAYRIAFDNNGNGLVAWRQGSSLFAKSYTGATSQWSTATTLSSTASGDPTLSVSANGNAIVAFTTTGNTVQARRYANGAWLGSSAELASNSALATARAPQASINNNGEAIVSFLETNAGGEQIFSNRYQGGAWAGITQLNTTSGSLDKHAAAIDANGNAQVVWSQNSTAEGTNNIYGRRFAAGGSRYYLIPSAATWSSVTQALYGTSNPAAASALQTLLGNPALTANTQLTGFPDTLNYTSLAPVSVSRLAASVAAAPSPLPSIYTVKASDVAAANPWAAITQTIYGSSNAAAITALKTALGTPTLSVGLRLTPPANLGYSNTQALSTGLIPTNVSLTATWTAQQTLESSSTAAYEPQMTFGPSGDGLSVWMQGPDLMASVFTKSTGLWSAPTSIDGNLAGDPYLPHLSISANGNMLVTWLQSPAATIHARRYINGAWDASSTTIPTLSTGQTNGNRYPAGAISDSGRAVVVFASGDGTRWNTVSNYFNGSTWQSTVSNLDDLGAVNNNTVDNNLLPRVAMDASGNATALWVQPAIGETAASLMVSRYTVSNGLWSSPSSTALENSTVNVDAYRIAFDNNGNGLVTWRQGSSLFAKSYTGTTNLWSAATTLSTTASGDPTLSMSANGNAVVAFATASNNVSARRYASGAWLGSSAELVSNSALATARAPQASINNNGEAIVSFLETNAGGEQIFSNRYQGGAWAGITQLNANSGALQKNYATAIDASGNAQVIWSQNSTAEGTNNIYGRRFSAGGSRYYLIPSGATWSSVTQALYGTSNPAAASALQTLLGNPALTANTQLTGFPDTLNYSTPVAVTATVNPGALSLPSTPSQSVYLALGTDTWASITQTLYGVSTVEAQDALKLALGTPTLAAGLRLTPPATLNYSGVNTGAATVLITDPLNNQNTVRTDAKGRLIELQGPALNGASQLVKYSYDDATSRLLTSTDARGLVTTYQYDANGNQTLVRDAAGNTVVRTYGSLNELLSETRYSVADPDGAGDLLPSGAETTRYVYSPATSTGAKNKLRYVISPEGRVTQYVYGTGATDKGAQISALQYTANLYSTAGTPTEANLDAWVAAITDKSNATRVDTAYDFRGQVSSITRYDALTTAGAGVTGASSSRTDYIYDAAGNLLKTIEAKGVATTAVTTDFITQYFYDGLARVYRFIDALGAATLTQFDDAGNKTTTTLANGLATTRSYNKLGELIGQAQADGAAALGTTSYVYDKNGHLRQSQDPTGVKNYRLYDAAGRQVAQIEADGSLVESVYNTNNQVVRTVRYATAVSAANVTALQADITAGTNTVTLDSLRPAANSSSDRSSWMLYDSGNRLAKSIDELGFVTETRYDGASRAVSSTRYNTALSSAQRAALSTTTLPSDANATVAVDAANDRTSRQLYGADSQLLGSLDAAGYLTENQYDGAGRLIHTTAYATQTPSAQWAAGTLAQLRPAANNAQDIHSWVFYNAKSQVVAEVNGEGYLSEHLFDANGNKTQTTRWANKALINPALITSATLIGALRPAGNAAQNQVTGWTYTDLNQLKTQTDFQDTVTQYSYDSVGQLIQTDKALGTAELRTLQTRYDKQGRVVGELTAEGSAALSTPAAGTTLTNLPTTLSNGATLQGSLGAEAAGWSAQQTLESSSTAAYEPQMTFGPSGDGLSVWMQGPDLMASVFTKSTGLWSAPTSIDGNLAGDPYLPHLSISANGNMLVTWLQSPAATIHARRYINGAWDASSTTIPTLSTGQTNGNRYPAGAISDSGRAVVVFASGDGTRWNTVSNYFNGSTWQSTVSNLDDLGAVNNNTVDNNLLPRVAMDASGNATALWVQPAIGETAASLMVSRYTVSNGLWSSPSSTALENSTVNVDAYRIAFDNNGNGLVTWRQGSSLFAKSYTGTTNLWSAATTLSTTASGDPTLSMSANGNAVVAFATASNNVSARRYASGAWLGSSAELVSNSALATARAPQASINNNGEAIVSFLETNAGGEQIFSNRYQGGAWAGITQLNANSGALQKNYATAIDASGNAQVIWSQNSTAEGTNNIYGKRFAVGSTGSYVVPLGATWESLAQTLYGNSSVATVAALKASSVGQSQANTVWAQYGLTHAYDQAGRRISTADQNGNKTLFFYNSDGNLVYTVNASGEVTETQYNALNQASQSIAYGTRLSAATLSTLTTLAGGLVNGTVTTAIAGLSNAALDSKTVFTYTQRGQLASSTQSVSSSLTDTNSATYNAFGERETQTSKIDGTNNVTTRYAYTQRGEQKSQTVDAVGGGLNILTQASYDAFGRVISQVDALGKPTSFSYDRLGRTVQTTGRLNIVRQTTFDAFSRVLTQVDGNNQTTSYAYDKTLRTVTVTTPESITTVTTANRHGETITLRDGRGNTTSYSYDVNGQLKTSTQDQLGISTSNSYDRAGRRILTTDARGTATKYEFDAANRVLKRTVDEGGLSLITHYTYDPKGQQVTVTDANGGITQTKYDLKGQAVEVIQDVGGLALRTQYSYDARGKTLTVVDANGVTTLYTYDKAGRRTKEQIDPTGLNLSRSYVYDANDNVIQAIDGKNQSSFYVYDLNERLVYSVDALGNTQKNDYDNEGRITKVTDYVNPISTSGLDSTALFGGQTFLSRISDRLTPNAAADVVEHRVYDKNGRLTTLVNALGEVTRFVLDANGNVQERRAYANRLTMGVGGTVPSDLQTQLTTIADNSRDQRVRSLYDALNRATHQIDGTGAVVKQVFDANGNVVDRIAYAKTIDPNFVLNAPSTLDAATALIADASKDARTRRVFDKANRVTWSADGVGAVSQFGYDKVGNVTKTVQYATAIASSDAAGTVPAANGSLDRVTDRVYDKANRRIYSVDALGQVTQFVYDNNGNLTQQVAHATTVSPVPQPSLGAVIGGAIGTYTKADVETRLGAGAATHPDNRTSRYAYDAANRQVFMVDAELGATEQVFDANSNVVQIKRYANRLTTVDALPATATVAQLRSRILPDTASDRTAQRQYDAANRLTVQIDGEGYASRNTYDGLGRVSTTTQYALKANNDGSTSSSANDRSNTFYYDQASRLTSSKDAMGFMEYFAYDGLSNKTSFTNKKNAVWTYSYDAAGRMKQETSPLVALTAMGVDANGKLLEGATTTASVLTQMSYDALGNLSSRIEAVGRPEQRETKYTYDAVGRQIKTEFPPVALYAGVGADSLLVNGVNQLAPRVETTLQTLYTETRYDALGNAVASRDVAGSMSYKTYDALGRVRFDVDALGYVTGHDRNVFGDETKLTRYAVQTALVNGSPASLSTSSVQSTVNGLNAAENREIKSDYDKRGLVTRVTEPTTYVYDANTGAYNTAGKVTTNSYNAFGEMTRSITPAGVGLTAENAVQGYFYDKRGKQIAMVDALGYLTTQQFDAVGNLENTVEYNAAVANWAASHATYSSAPTVSVQGDDRRVEYTYDLNNRKRSDIRKGVVVDQAGATTGSTYAIRGVRIDLTTSYGYDAVGNLTKTVDAAGGTTYSYYDALGRTLAVVAPGAVLSSTTAGVTTQNTILPLTEFKRDAFGNVLVKTEHALGALVTANENTAIASLALNAGHADNRKTLGRYDAQGHAIQSADANGVNRYMSYNALGLVAKEWQGVRDFNGQLQTTFRLYDYDKLGRLTGTVEPSANWVNLGGSRLSAAGGIAQTALSINQQTYNAFGEIIFRGGSELNDTVTNVNGRLTSTNPKAGQQEWFRYDKAGRLLATNAEDGQSKYYLYNLQGQRTAEIRSAGVGRSNINLDGYTDLNYDLSSTDQITKRGIGAISLLTDVRRSNYKLDLLGRTTEEQQPERQSYSATAGTTWAKPIVLRAYDRWGNVKSVTDPRNNQWVTRFDYNANNQVIRQTISDVNTAPGTSPVPQGNLATPLTTGSLNDVVTEVFYDALGRQIATKDANNKVSATEYNALGQVVRQINADHSSTVNAATQNRYSAFGDKVATVDANNNTTTSQYDKLGQLLQTTRAAVDVYQASMEASTTVTGNVIVALQGNLNTTERYTWNEAGLRLTQTDANNNTTKYRYDLRGNLVETVQPLGQSSQSAWDNQGRKLVEQNANGDRLTWTVDYFGLALSHTDFGGATFSYSYDNARQLINQVETNWNAARYEVSIPSSAAVQVISNPQNLRYQYDAAGQLTRISDGGGQFTFYDYDLSGHRTLEVTTRDGTAYQGNINAYDFLGRLRVSESVVQFKASRDAGIDNKIYMMFNPGVSGVPLGYAAAPRGMTQDEYAIWHRGMFGNRPEEPARVLDLPAAVPSSQRRHNIADAWNKLGTLRAGVASGPKMMAAYVIENRVSIPELIDAIGITQGGVNPTETAVRQYFESNQWGIVVPPAEYDIAVAPYGDLQLGYLTPDRTASYRSLMQANYLRPRALAMAMLEYQVRPADLAAANGISLTTLQQYFSNHGIDPSQYDFAQKAQVYDPQASVTLQTQIAGYFASGDRWGLANFMLTNRLTPSDIAMGAAAGGEISTGLVHLFMAQVGVPRSSYDIAYAPLPSSTLANWDNAIDASGVAGRLSSVSSIALRHANFASNVRSLNNNPEALAAFMLQYGVSPAELATAVGMSVPAVRSYFANFGIAPLNYDITEFKKDELNTPTVIESLRFSRDNPSWDSAKPKATVQIEYDKAGNRTKIRTGVYDTNTNPGINNAAGTFDEQYFTYDAMNRQIGVNLTQSLGLDADAHLITYDGVGNRKSDTYLGNRLVETGTAQTIIGETGDGAQTTTYIARSLSTSANTAVTEKYTYDAQNRLTTVQRDDVKRGSTLNNFNDFLAADNSAGIALTDLALQTRLYDAAGQVLSSSSPSAALGVLSESIRKVWGNGPGFGDKTERSFYDSNGRVLVQQVDTVDYVKGGGARDVRGYDVLYQGSGTNNSSLGPGNGNVANGAYAQANGYDAAGNVLQYTIRDHRDNMRLSTYRMEYSKREHMLQTKTSGWRNGTPSQDTPVVTLQVYDGNGNLRDVKNPKNAADAITRSYVTDINGTVLRAWQAGGNEQFQLVSNGQVLGRYGQMAKASAPTQFEGRKDFNFVYQGVGDRYPATAPSSYTVNEGDTLQGIAKAVWGDPGQWYLIAEANGLADDSGLTLGQVLRIPNRATGGANNDSTFKPYDPSAVIGDTTPVLPLPPPPKKKCGGLGQIIMIVVAVVVSVYSVGVLSGFSGGFMATMQAGLGVMGVGAGVGVGAAGAFGAAGSVLGTVGTLAAGAAIGSAASQLVGMAIGAQDKFSWKQVGLAAIGGGVSGALQGVNFTSAVGANALNSTGNVIVRAAVGSAISQGIGVATGLQSSFSWRAVAASAITAGVGKAIGGALDSSGAFNDAFGPAGGAFAREFTTRFISGTVAQAITAKGGKIHVGQIAADAFGQSLASSIVGQITQGSQQAGMAPSYQGEGTYARPYVQDGSLDHIVFGAPNPNSWDAGALTTNLPPDTRSLQEQLDAAEKNLLNWSQPQVPFEPVLMVSASDAMKKVKGFFNQIGDVITDAGDAVSGAYSSLFPSEEVRQQQGLAIERRRRDAELKSQGVVDTGFGCSPLDPFGTGNNPGEVKATPNPATSSYGYQQSESLSTGIVLGAMLTPQGLVANTGVTGFRFGTDIQNGDYSSALQNGGLFGLDLLSAGGASRTNSLFGRTAEQLSLENRFFEAGERLRTPTLPIPGIGNAEGPSFTRYLNNVTNPEVRASMVEQASALRAVLPTELQGKGNLAVARIDIPGLPDTMKAYSRFDSGELGYVPMPTGPRVFEPLAVDKYGAVDTAGSFLRNVDGEFKILETTAQRLGKNPAAAGRIDLFTELKACTSCGGAIVQFRARYPNIQLNVFTGKL